eukprot:SAG25_NODE_1822_length_2292_cov_1.974920_2_plen_204_part_00
MMARHGATGHLLLSGQQVTADRHRTRRWTTGSCGGITVEQCVAPRVRSAGARELWQLRGTHHAAQMRRQRITRTELGSIANPVIQTPCKLRPPPTLVTRPGWPPPPPASSSRDRAAAACVASGGAELVLAHALARSLARSLGLSLLDRQARGVVCWRGGGGDVAALLGWHPGGRPGHMGCGCCCRAVHAPSFPSSHRPVRLRG